MISLTRDKNFNYGSYPITFVLNQEKLTNRYKIIPKDYYYRTIGKRLLPKSNAKREWNFEAEEVVDSKEIIDLHKYLMKVVVSDNIDWIKDRVQDLKQEAINYSNKYDIMFYYMNGEKWI